MTTPFVDLDGNLAAERIVGEAKGGDELLAAIIAEPDVIQHRLVYADWLLGQGDARGELIQLCESAAGDAESKARIAQLEARHGEAIAGEVAQLARHHTLSRGFVERVEMSAPTFAQHGARLLAAHPIRRLDLEPVTAEALALLARVEALRSLRCLHLEQNIERVEALALDDLCASSFFDMLERLEVWKWSCTGETEAAFAQLRAPKLHGLSTWRVRGASQIIAGITRNAEIQLHDLEISTHSHEHWSALAAPAFQRLRRLLLDVPPLAAELLLDAAELPRLEQLEVHGGLDCSASLLRRWLMQLPNLRALAVWRFDQLDVNGAIEAVLALPAEHPLAAVYFPFRHADPALLERLHQRCGADFPFMLREQGRT